MNKNRLDTPLTLLLLFLLPLLFAPAAFAISEDELLRVEDAFRFNADEKQPGVIELDWTIADGYYLYRDKFKFEVGDGLKLPQQPELPKGKIKSDPNFGDVEILRGKLHLSLPYEFESGAKGPGKLTLRYQGCADLGVCYPPQRKTVLVDAPEQATQAAPAKRGSVAAALAAAAKPSPFERLKSLTGGIGGDEEQPLLPSDEAFAFSAELASPNMVVAHWDIADGYHLYKDKIKAQLESDSNLELGQPDFPKGEMEDDLEGGLTEVYRGPLTLKFPIIGLTGKPPSKLGLKIGYQGCADQGVCYPPVRKRIDFDEVQLALLSAAGDHSARATAAAEEATQAPSPPPPMGMEGGVVSEQDAIAERLASGNMLLTLVAFFGFGLLLSLTPCVFPMIPILSGIIVGQGEQITTHRSFMLSLAYVLAMAAVYAVVGVIAAMTGANLQIAFQNPWVLIAFAGLFVALALSLFGFYELQMPAAIQSRLTAVSNKQKGGSLAGAAVMGVLSALIVGPCVTAPLMGALVYISQTGDGLLGGLALFFMGLGMGVPLLLLGLSAGSLLPKAGAWMDAVKAVFGVMMLGVAIWFLERVLPSAVTMFLWAALLILSGVYMGAFHGYGKVGHKLMPLWKGLGLMLIVWGVLILVGMAAGNGNPLQPLRGLAGGGGTMMGASAGAEARRELAFRPIKGVDGLEAALREATARNRMVMLDFSAEWCVTCKELDEFTFSDPGVHQVLADVMLLRADVTANDERDKALLKRFGIIGPPAILFFGPDGKERRSYRVVGFMDAEAFRAHVLKAKGQ